MNPELLRRIGEALYGERYQVALAAALGVSDRTMRRWVAGEYQIPDGVRDDLLALIRERSGNLGHLYREVKCGGGLPQTRE